jgi:hypothetical protein
LDPILKEVTLSFMENLEKMKDIIPGFKLPETSEFKSPDTCDPNEPYSIMPSSTSCRAFRKFGAKGQDLKTTIVLTGAVNKELGVAASARLKLVLALGSGDVDLKLNGVGSEVKYGDLGSVEFDITMTAKTQPCNLLNMDITLEGTITFGLGNTKQKTCGVSTPAELATFTSSMYSGDVKFPNIQHCLYEAIKIADTTGKAAPLLKPDDTSGKTTLTIPQQAFTIAAGDDLVKVSDCAPSAARAVQ